MYHSHSIQLTENHKKLVKKALENKAPVNLRLKHSNLNGSDVVHLTQTQIKRLEKAHNAGKGADLKLSHKQLSHSVKKGGFIVPFMIAKKLGFGTGAVGAKKVGGNALIGALVMKKALGFGVGKKRKRGKFTGFLSDLAGGAQSLGKKILDVGVDKGVGVAGKLFEAALMDKFGPKKEKKGEGFGDILNAGKNLGSKLVNVGLDKAPDVAGKLAEAMIMKRLLGKGVKKPRKTKKGDGLFDFVEDVTNTVTRSALPIAGNLAGTLGPKLAEQMLMKKLLGGKGLKEDIVDGVNRVVGGLPNMLLAKTAKDVYRKLKRAKGLVAPGY